MATACETPIQTPKPKVTRKTALFPIVGLVAFFLYTYLFVWYGIFLDIIVPAESVSGELVRVYLIQREQGTRACGPAIASLVTHRLLGMAMNVAILFFGMGLLFTEGQI